MMVKFCFHVPINTISSLNYIQLIVVPLNCALDTLEFAVVAKTEEFPFCNVGGFTLSLLMFFSCKTKSKVHQVIVYL